MDFLLSIWKYLLLSSPFLLFGIILAGIIHAFLPEGKVRTILGKKGIWPIFKGALIGVPLPLCSCAVIPTAVLFKKSGASNGATSSFLISTPETGVDSIAMTYALMDFPMTLIRPFAAFLTGLLAGIFQMIFNDYEAPISESIAPASCCENVQKQETFYQKVVRGIRFGFNDLLDDMAIWLVIGILAGAFIDYFLPADIFLNFNGPLGRILIILLGIPMYICASATTPLAASMILKGMSPGSALLILLVGPSTNISNILVLQKFIGKKGVLINVMTIGLVSFGLSFLVDYLYLTFSWPLDFKIGVSHAGELSTFPYQILAVVMTILIFRGVIREKFLKGKH